MKIIRFSLMSRHSELGRQMEALEAAEAAGGRARRRTEFSFDVAASRLSRPRPLGLPAR
jgi:hypothetical protein